MPGRRGQPRRKTVTGLQEDGGTEEHVSERRHAGYRRGGTQRGEGTVDQRTIVFRNNGLARPRQSVIAVFGHFLRLNRRFRERVLDREGFPVQRVLDRAGPAQRDELGGEDEQ